MHGDWTNKHDQMYFRPLYFLEWKHKVYSANVPTKKKKKKKKKKFLEETEIKTKKRNFTKCRLTKKL